MVKMNYQKVQIHVITDFNQNLNLINYLSHNFQRCLGKLKLKHKQVTEMEAVVYQIRQ